MSISDMFEGSAASVFEEPVAGISNSSPRIDSVDRDGCPIPCAGLNVHIGPDWTGDLDFEDWPSSRLSGFIENQNDCIIGAHASPGIRAQGLPLPGAVAHQPTAPRESPLERVIEASMEQRRNERRGKREIPEKTRRPAASSGTIPTCKNPGVARPGIEPGSPCWEASKANRSATVGPLGK
ncbi:hypothetical protein PR048_021168 [Dryococelus australis]|uniref:Uncharacterized protein n=1 Tax=Dryococelus australis TaxID=614101 RepID=A0ABQ9GXG4_9NEOP|nr:hypothetical protein PR048_021168 [Dryococelus australis]